MRRFPSEPHDYLRAIFRRTCSAIASGGLFLTPRHFLFWEVSTTKLTPVSAWRQTPVRVWLPDHGSNVGPAVPTRWTVPKPSRYSDVPTFRPGTGIQADPRTTWCLRTAAAVALSRPRASANH